MILALSLATLLTYSDAALGLLVTEPALSGLPCLCYRDGTPIWWASQDH